MKKNKTYIYYPGCSLEGSAREYDISTRAFLKSAGAELTDLPDWTCCGASAAEGVSDLLSVSLGARNIAVAEKAFDTGDILAPCSACYLNLKKADQRMKTEPGLKEEVNQVLSSVDLEIKESLPVRHLLDVVVNDIGPGAIKDLVQYDLSGMVVAPYYGCQCLRPYAVFDDPEKPESMTPLLEAAGAVVHPFPMASKCCGASHMNTKMDVGLELVGAILKSAKGADAIVTVCPMCQMNLEAWQKKISARAGEDLSITILYLPQLLGLAAGLEEKELGMEYNLAITRDFKEKVKQIKQNGGQS